ncbi:lachesin-like isoform X2 [Stegodyphus dumicola]|nr:lachesin-like isoform X2 [Stegodyphus dumicola]
MLSTPSHVNVIQGDSIVLPCNVLNIGRNVRVWKQQPTTLLFSGAITVFKSPKFSLVNQSSLLIENVEPEDAGEYICQISNHPFVDVTHQVHVSVPSSVSPDPPDGLVISQKGEMATMRCNTKGTPIPRVTWTYYIGNVLYGSLPSGIRQHGSGLHIASTDAHHAGTYVCTADNGVGEPVKASFNLTVHYAPEVLVKPEWAHGDEGATVEFLCTSNSFPISQVAWLQGNLKQGKLLFSDDRISVTEKKTASSTVEVSLKIQRMLRSDLGAYTCVANNLVGKSWKTVEVSGLAEPVQLRGHESGESSFLLLWTVKSFSPIIEYQLKIRRHKSGDDWTDVMIPVAEDGFQQSLLYTQSYNVTGLEPGSRYEAVLQAHNDFGWNRPSDTLYFDVGEKLTSPSLEQDDPKTQPSLLPLYDIELDVTDPTYSKQGAQREACFYSIILLSMLTVMLFFP